MGSLARVEASQGSSVHEDLITNAANVEPADGSLQYLSPQESHNQWLTNVTNKLLAILCKAR